MKRKLCLFISIFIAIIATLFAVWMFKPGKVSVRSAGQKVDAAGRIHIIYDIKNETRSRVQLTLRRLEVRHERTGWSEVPLLAGSDWMILWPENKTIGIQKTLDPLSSVQFEVLPPSGRINGTTVRGEVESRATMEGNGGIKFRLMSLGLKLGLPSRWFNSGGPILIDLPQTELPTPVATPMPATAKINTATVPSRQSVEPGEANIVMNLNNANLMAILNFYAELADVNLEIDASVRALPTTISFHINEPSTRSAVVTLMEKALQDEAGVQIKRLKDKRAAVTYDQKLKTKNLASESNLEQKKD